MRELRHHARIAGSPQLDVAPIASLPASVPNRLVEIAITGTANAEFESLTETGIQVLALPPIRSDMPISILIAPDTSDSAIARFDNEKRRDFVLLYPGARMREIDCSHDVPQVCPQAVIDSVQEVLKGIVPRFVPHP